MTWLCLIYNPIIKKQLETNVFYFVTFKMYLPDFKSD